MDWDTALPLVSALTQDLALAVNAPTSTQEGLIAAQKAIGLSVLAAQDVKSFGLISAVDITNPPEVEDASSLEYLRPASIPPTGTWRSLRREFAISISTDPRKDYSITAGQLPSSTYGPFIDGFGRAIAIDVFTPTNTTALNFGNADPYIYLSMPLIRNPPTSSVASIGGGSVWIPTSQFSASAPSDSFVGLRVDGGDFRFFAVPGGTLLVLKLQLPASNNGSSFSVSTPSHVTFVFRSNTNGAKLNSVADSSFSAFGTTVKLTYLDHPSGYDSTFSNLLFPLTADTAMYTATMNTLKLTKLNGSAQIQGAAWALPAAILPARNFPEASGVGRLTIFLGAGFSLIPLAPVSPISCNKSVLVVDSSMVAISGMSATSSNKSHIVLLNDREANAETAEQPQTMGKQSAINLRTPAPFPFRYVYQANGNESWGFISTLQASLDRPRTANNTLVPFTGLCLSVLISEPFNPHPTLSISGDSEKSDNYPAMLSYSIKNLFFKTQYPSHFAVSGPLVDGIMNSGVVTLTAALRYVLPILPDPYTSNVIYSPGPAIDTGIIGMMKMTIFWDIETPSALDLSLPSSSLSRVSFGHPQTRVLSRELLAIEESYGIIPLDGPVMLDLSTNVSQFGVSFSSPNAPTTISGLSVQTRASSLRIFALPAVQWEPVVTADSLSLAGSDPEVWAFPDSGPATEIANRSVTMIPISPRDAIDGVLHEYNNAPSIPLVARLSLPFGIVAVVQSIQTVPAIPSSFLLPLPPVVRQVQPVFGATMAAAHHSSSGTALTGSDQISMRLQDPDSTSSPSFEGAALPLSMGLNGSNTISSVLPDVIFAAFQKDFQNKVPVTRIDLSGFGASLFSHWETKPPNEIGISKVHFDVITGRTAKEVVEMNSILFPYAVRVVRAITIERANSGVVVRRDSGWQATSDGKYDYSVKDVSISIVTHPGVVKGVSNVTNIREINDPIHKLVNFDCTVHLESGGGIVEVPARDQLGYIAAGSPASSTADSGVENPIALPSPEEYASKLGLFALGGAIDVVIEVFKSGLKMRLTSVSVGATRKDQSSPPQFAMAAWGSPALPGGGQWSFTQTVNGIAPQVVDGIKGVPLIREGAYDLPTIPFQNAYSFADPSDLLASAKNTVYGIVHATDSHRLMFPQPVIFPDLSQKGLTSLQQLVLADTFALGTSTGIFPVFENCIPIPRLDANLPDPSQLLHIIDGNDLLFNLDNIKLPDIPRELGKDENMTSIVQTAGNLLPDGTRATHLNVLIDSLHQARTMSLTNFSNIIKNETGKEVNRVIGDLSSKADEITKLVNPEHIFGEALQDVKKVVSFLDTLGVLPPLKVSMTNEWSLEISTSMGLDDFLAKIKDPITQNLMRKIIQDLSFFMSARSTLSAATFKLKMHLTIKIDSGFGPMALGVAGFDLGLSTNTGLTLALDLGVGVGVAFEVGPFGALAYYSQTQTITKGQKSWGIGATAVVKAHVDLLVAEADVCIEATLMLLGGTCLHHKDTTTIIGWAQVSIALDVSIFWVVNVSVHESAEWQNTFKDGGCTLPDLESA
ncbi:hypothetical protein EDB80DRAFT_869542 [Ilyonectria destructans]|nr:hypothetical protein EDB80DRAFT_869542 [Ilyonectria destructans]